MTLELDWNKPELAYLSAQKSCATDCGANIFWDGNGIKPLQDWGLRFEFRLGHWYLFIRDSLYYVAVV
jgi:hypothetical protein